MYCGLLECALWTSTLLLHAWHCRLLENILWSNTTVGMGWGVPRIELGGAPSVGHGSTDKGEL